MFLNCTYYDEAKKEKQLNPAIFFVVFQSADAKTKFYSSMSTHCKEANINTKINNLCRYLDSYAGINTALEDRCSVS